MPGIGHNSGEDPEDLDFSDLEGMTLEEVLRAGQKAIFVQLVGVVRSGKASHQELAILRNLLKDNGLTLGIPPATEDSREEPAELPEFGKPEWEP
jgi:hypothetical protein